MISTFDDAEAVAHAAVERVLAAARRGDEAHAIRIGLSGGSTPERLYARLASATGADRSALQRLEILFADERAVPPDHPDSNYGRVRALLLDPLAIAPSRVHRMRGEADDLNEAALEYEARVSTPLDLLVLGVGPDGHTASIFPRRPAAAERERRVVVVTDSPKPPPRRITVTPRVIEEAREVIVLVTGAEKAGALAAALEGRCDPFELPACGLRNRDWLVDRAAVARLTRTG